MRISRAILTVAFLAVATQAIGAGNRQTLINHLLAVHDALDRMCRGWSGDDPHTTEACDARNIASDALRDVGICLIGMGSESHWGNCR